MLATEEPATSAKPPDIERLSSISDVGAILGRTAEALQTIRLNDRRYLKRFVRAGFDFVNRQLELDDRRRRGMKTTDAFGFDSDWTETFLPVMGWIYRNWWRVQTYGVENVPSEGAALLVANHAGVIPYDGAMVRTAIFLEHSTHRHTRALVLNQLMSTPFVSWFMRRSGNTLATETDAEALLNRGNLVIVFPEGSKGAGKPFGERYRLRRFGRGGFAEIALRTGVPVIPISIVGSEEIHPMLYNIASLAKLLGQPYVPITPTLPLLGPLGAVPLPSNWVIEFHEPIVQKTHRPQDADDAGKVLRLSDQVRDIIQAGVYRNLERRGSVFGPHRRWDEQPVSEPTGE